MALIPDLSYLTPSGTARYTLSQVHIRTPRPVVLIVRPSGEANEPYQAALKSAVLKGAIDNRGVATLFARHVVVDWEHVCGEDGQPAPCKAEAVEELLHALLAAKRADIVVGLFGFCADPDHFRDLTTPGGEPLGNG